VDIHAIKDPQFLKELSIKELESLSQDIRTFLIQELAKTGGHLASNLGVVELTIAMHKVFDSPKDHLLFDVGHQGYTHKILTGRANQFSTLRQTDGLSGFLKRSESEHDCFEAGHSSTSLAAAAGLLFAKEFDSSIGEVVALIGDGSLGSGMALESLNFLGHYGDKHPIIILNDNEMSISPNVGHLAKMLTNVRTRKRYRSLRRKSKRFIPSFLKGFVSKAEKRFRGFISGTTYFESMGFLYFGPIDGHNIKQLVTVLEAAKQEDKPCVVHVRTHKGKGFSPSEADKLGKWHGVSPFNPDNGHFIKSNAQDLYSYSTIVAKYLEDRAERNHALKVITPAMIGGSDLGRFQKKFPNQLIDVGIAEQTAATLAAALALKNTPTFLTIYSTFLQRAYDQVSHDIARHKAHVVIGIDRAGLVGGDGETHQGIYDIPMLSHIPNMTIAQGKNAEETFALLNYAFDTHTGPIALRYPREHTVYDFEKGFDPYPITTPSWDKILNGNQATLITFGPMVEVLKEKIEALNLDITLINARFIKPLDTKMLKAINKDIPLIIHEESTLIGGLGEQIITALAKTGHLPKKIKTFGFDDCFVPQGAKDTMLKRYKIDADSVIKYLKDLSL